ncbi:MAG: STM4015 family protein [Polyangiaceae bacterium]
MVIERDTEFFAGMPVRQFDPTDALRSSRTAAYRVAVDWDWSDGGESIVDLLENLAERSVAEQLGALLIGDWGGAAQGNDSAPAVKALVRLAPKLSGLRALFLGDMTYEECEISWIQQCDLSSLLAAYPALEELRVRGKGMSLGRLTHTHLRRLVIESGGLDRKVLRQVAAASLPALEHLEIWTGDRGYGGNGTMRDVTPLLDAGRFPKLKHLGLRNSQLADAVATAAAASALVPTLDVLDLSLGTMTDKGASALASSAGVRALGKLDVYHNYISEAGCARLRTLGIEVDLGYQRNIDGKRSVAVSE